MSRTPNDEDEAARGMPRRAALARLGALGAGAALASACGDRGWTPPEDDPFGRSMAKPYVPGAEAFGTHEERWTNTSCAQCAAGCGVRVRVVEGRAVRVEGNPKNPLNQGGIGPRGLASLQALYDADRLTGPMARVGGRLVPISWDDALAKLTAQLAELRARSAPHELLVMSGRERGFMNDLLARFCRAFGTPNFVDGRPGRSGTLAQAVEATLGQLESPAFDWTGAECVLSLEAGLFEDSCQAVYLARVAGAQRRGRGVRARVIHAGSSFDLTAHNADRWLRIHPGAGGALALGLAHVLIDEQRHDATFVRDRTDGFPAFASLVAGYTPARTAELTGLAPDAIVELARELAERRPAFAMVDERSLTYSNGWHTAVAALGLNALLGAIHAPAGGVRVAPRPPYREWPEVVPDAVAARGLASARLDRAGAPEFPRARSLHETIPERLAGGEKIGVALLYYANPAFTRQQPERWKRALDAIPFVVSFSPFRDETVESVADLVLPDHTYLERWEDAAAAPALPRAVVGVRRPVVEPLHDTRATGDVVLALARGLGQPMAAAFPWPTFQAAMEERLIGLHESGRGSFIAPGPREFFETLYQEGVWYEAEAQPPTDVRFRFEASAAEPEWSGDPARFPLRLLPYRPLGYAEGSGANLPWLRVLRGRPGTDGWHPAAALHPDSAPGIGDGDLVRLTSEFGAIVVRARLDVHMERDTVALPMGGGHTALGRWAEGLGVNPMALLRPGPAPITGSALVCATRVRAERVS